MKWAIYDLNKEPPNFDFLTFCQFALGADAEGVCFIPDQKEEEHTRAGETGMQAGLNTICFPACELYGLAWRLNEPERDGDIVWPPRIKHVSHRFEMIHKLQKPHPLMPSALALERARRAHPEPPIVVALREYAHQPERNSTPSLRRWGERHRAVILEDYTKEPVSLDDRVALYEIAKVVVGSGAGVMLPALYSSHRPYLCLRINFDQYYKTSLKRFEQHGWKHGDQFAFVGPRQRLCWTRDENEETIEHEYQRWLAECGP